MTHLRTCSLLASLLLALSASAGAQVRASELATVSQTIDGTTLTVEYSRPRARGRSPIFGDLITWGEVWTPGANWATTLDVSKDVTIEGHALPKGKYSVWMEVQPTEWTVIFSPKAKLFHTVHPKPDSTQIRFAITPDSGEGPEVLTWSFPDISMTGTTMRMAWAGRSVSLRVAVTPSHPLTLAAARADRFVGNYSLRWIPRDSTEAKQDTAPPPPETWKLTYARDMLLMDWEVPGDEEAPYHAVLIAIGEDTFYPGFFEDDDIFDAAPNLVTEFALSNGRATSFVIRGRDDRVVAEGTRVP
jgi:hypothetical protein